MCGAGWGVVRRLPARLEVRSAIVRWKRDPHSDYRFSMRYNLLPTVKQSSPIKSGYV